MVLPPGGALPPPDPLAGHGEAARAGEREPESTPARSAPEVCSVSHLRQADPPNHTRSLSISPAT